MQLSVQLVIFLVISYLGKLASFVQLCKRILVIELEDSLRKCKEKNIGILKGYFKLLKELFICFQNLLQKDIIYCPCQMEDPGNCRPKK